MSSQVATNAANAARVANATAGTVATNAAVATKGIANKMKGLVSENLHVVIFIGIVILVFVIVIIYIVVAMKGAGLSGKSLTTTPIRLDGNNSPKTIPGDNIPVPSVGREYTYSFWIYLDSYAQTSGSSKMIWYRGSENDISSANPIVYMDEMTNKMYFVVKTQNSVLSGATGDNDYGSDIGAVKRLNYFMNDDLTTDILHNKHIIIPVDYVPLQRWLNFIMVIDNKIITLYMDGEIYSVKTVDEVKALRHEHNPEYDTNGNRLDYSLIVDKTEGNIFTGKNPVSSRNVTINGYLSKMDFFNYAISTHDVKKVYNAGPFSKSFLSMFGSKYGVRSPVYKMSESVE